MACSAIFTQFLGGIFRSGDRLGNRNSENHMIYLPEVEIIRRDLERDVAGKKVKSVDVHSTKSIKPGGNKTKLTGLLEGIKIVGTRRVGRHILFDLENEAIMAVHLGSGGQLRRHANKDAVDPKTAVIVAFTQMGQLRLVDMAGDAVLFAVPDEETLLEAAPELNSVGMDPLANPMSWTDFGREILSHRVKLKSLLTDESIIVGLGDVYSDEVLFSAGLRYDRMSDSLNTQELRRFYRAVVETLHDAVKYRGTSLEGSPYTDPEGNTGSYQDHLQVYGRDGALSPRSRQPIVRKKYSGRWTYFCEQSQV